MELETQEDEENRLSVASRVKPKQPEKAEEETKEINAKQNDAQVELLGQLGFLDEIKEQDKQ